MPRRIDRFDAAILCALQRDARITAEALSASVGLSAAACQKRLRRLRAEGFVEADLAVIDPGRIGRGLMTVLQVTLASEDWQRLGAFAARMAARPEVMQCYRVTGEAHFVVLMTARDVADYDRFCREHVYAAGDVQRLVTSVVKERVKATFYQPVEPCA